MSSADLRPPNSTALERALAEAGSPRGIDPDVIRTLWNADLCPPEFLPQLAWSLSVDFWELATTDEQRRELIRGAIQWHRKRGTPWAIKQALAAFGYPVMELIEQAKYLEEWKVAGGQILDGSWLLDGSVVLAVPGNPASGEVVRRSALNHWAEYSIRLNAADGIWTHADQQKIRKVAESFAPERSHLVALIAAVEARFSAGVTLKSLAGRVRARLQGKQRYQPLARRTLDGNWMLNGGPAPLPLDGWRLDGRVLDGVRLTGVALDNSHITLQQKLTLRTRMAMGGDGLKCSTVMRVHRNGFVTEVRL